MTLTQLKRDLSWPQDNTPKPRVWLYRDLYSKNSYPFGLWYGRCDGVTELIGTRALFSHREAVEFYLETLRERRAAHKKSLVEELIEALN